MSVFQWLMVSSDIVYLNPCLILYTYMYEILPHSPWWLHTAMHWNVS